MHSDVNVLNATEPYTKKMVNIVNFMSILPQQKIKIKKDKKEIQTENKDLIGLAGH